MGFSTPATRSTDIPIIEINPRQLPPGVENPFWNPTRIATPAKEPMPVKRSN